jgi:hypothetical protein
VVPTRYFFSLVNLQWYQCWFLVMAFIFRFVCSVINLLKVRISNCLHGFISVCGEVISRRIVYVYGKYALRYAGSHIHYVWRFLVRGPRCPHWRSSPPMSQSPATGPSQVRADAFRSEQLNPPGQRYCFHIRTAGPFEVRAVTFSGQSCWTLLGLSYGFQIRPTRFS